MFAAGGFATYLVIVAVISLVATAFLPETYRRDILPSRDGTRSDQRVAEAPGAAEG